jgi:alpha-tubulin suppressor-like RCC1 family protein
LGNGVDGLGAAAIPVAVRGIDDGVLVAGGVQNSWVLRASGAVVGWGANQHGLLGDGTSVVRTTPVAVAGIAGAVDLSAAGDHACVVLSNGHVACWGENENGQLGDGSQTGSGSLAPVEADGIVTAVEVVVGSGHSCALLTDGQLVCWGDNLAGQLGRGGATSYPRPVVVRGL